MRSASTRVWSSASGSRVASDAIRKRSCEACSADRGDPVMSSPDERDASAVPVGTRRPGHRTPPRRRTVQRTAMSAPPAARNVAGQREDGQAVDRVPSARFVGDRGRPTARCRSCGSVPFVTSMVSARGARGGARTAGIERDAGRCSDEPGQAERGEAEGERPGDAVARGPDDPPPARDEAARTEALGVGRGQGEVARSGAGVAASAGRRQGDEVVVQPGALGQARAGLWPRAGRPRSAAAAMAIGSWPEVQDGAPSATEQLHPVLEQAAQGESTAVDPRLDRARARRRSSRRSRRSRSPRRRRGRWPCAGRR